MISKEEQRNIAIDTYKAMYNSELIVSCLAEIADYVSLLIKHVVSCEKKKINFASTEFVERYNYALSAIKNIKEELKRIYKRKSITKSMLQPLSSYIENCLIADVQAYVIDNIIDISAINKPHDLRQHLAAFAKNNSQLIKNIYYFLCKLRNAKLRFAKSQESHLLIFAVTEAKRNIDVVRNNLELTMHPFKKNIFILN